MSREASLIVADSERDADLLYAMGMFVPDPIIFLRIDGRARLVLGDLEVDRARRQAKKCRVYPLSYFAPALKKGGARPNDFAEIIHLLLREKRIKKVSVPSSFPVGLARDLEARKIRVEPCVGDFFPERAVKRADEIKKIQAALMMAEVGLAEGIEVIKRARIASDGRLIYQNNPLTSERLRAVIDTAIVQAGGLARHTIVAGGKQGCDAHEQGYGPLRAHQPIVLDVFPRSQKTGYFGDITRTVVRGRASEALRKMYDTVKRAQELGIKKVADGIYGRELHQAVKEFFEREGYRTGRMNGRLQGFFHSTGHGIGLEIHETPRLGKNSDDQLRVGHVVTVEPGLYYSRLGGVRLEDVVCVTGRGSRVLTRFEKVLEV